jgi:DNA-binding transcriptional ArsR family regulator
MSNRSEGWHFACAEAAVMLCPALSAEARVLYYALLFHARNQGACWPSLGRLAALLGTSERTVQRHLSVLVRIGVVEVERRYGHHSNLYWLNDRDPEVLRRLERMQEGGEATISSPETRREWRAEIEEVEREEETLSQLYMPVVHPPTSQAGCRQYSTGVRETLNGMPEEEAIEAMWDNDPFSDEAGGA